MTEKIIVRAATSADGAALAAHEPRSGLAAELLSKVGEQYTFAVAWRGEEPLGWCVLDSARDELTPEMMHMWVFPQARRQGVGRALAAWLEDQARAAGHREVFLLVDPEQESQAIPLYVELDYTPTGHHMGGVVYETGERTPHQAIYRKSLMISE